jgi:hypothetical protein
LSRDDALERQVQPGDRATHDALGADQNGDRAYAPHQPPAPVAERPSGRRPGPRAQWVPGYWEWDPQAGEFAWTGGVWQVPPPRKVWVPGRWLRDQGGWYRAQGYWGPRRDPFVARNQFAAASEPAWRAAGPPADHPPDVPSAAPAPDYFYIAGYYAPLGDQLKWTPGFWAKVQPGWEWLPARWVRRPNGWEFRAGRWAPDGDGTDLRVTLGAPPSGRTVVRKPAPQAGDVSQDEPSDLARDPIAPAEEVLAPPVFPVLVMPYYVIRPPGSFPYGPGGVIVPGVVPPFVRRILDQVLP